VRKYLAIARASLEVIFVYRSSFALNTFGTVFYVVAMFYLWQTIFLGKPGALGNVQIPWTPGRVLMVVILVASAATIRVALNLGTAAISFWVRSPWSMVPMFVHQLGEFAKYPITIYSVAVQAVIVVAIPFAFVSFFPTAYIFGVDAWSLLGLLTPLIAVYCLFMAVTVFRIGLRRYESTGH
jgi:ABC-2 type transport system permease protein